jgi:hypothetical protein
MVLLGKKFKKYHVMICFCVLKVFLKKFKNFYLYFFASNEYYFMFLYHFDALMSKNNFLKNKKYYFNIFSNKKHFKKQL